LGSIRRVFLCVAVFLLPLVANLSPVLALQSTFYFHDNSELTLTYPSFQIRGYQISGIQANAVSSSARVFESANSTSPAGSGLSLMMSCMISVSSQPQVYAAFAAWVTVPFPVDVTLDGNVVMHVWMSSNDTLLPWQGSELFMGIADYSPTGSTPFQLLDDYLGNATIGYNGLSSSPTEYVISTLRINQHLFQAGSMLMFFAGAGSNKQGYGFTVYFDSSSWPSRADIPADPTLDAPEFNNLGWVLIPAFLILLMGTVVRKRGLKYSCR